MMKPPARTSLTISPARAISSRKSEYNVLGQLEKITYPDASQVSFKWNCCSVTQMEDATGLTDIHHDSLFRINSVLDSNGNMVDYNWDGLDNITRMSVNGVAMVDYEHDENNRLKRILPYDGQNKNLTHNSSAQRTDETTPDNYTITHQHNPFSRLFKSTYSNSLLNRMISRNLGYLGVEGKGHLWVSSLDLGTIHPPVLEHMIDYHHEVEYYPNRQIKTETFKDKNGNIFWKHSYLWYKNWRIRRDKDELTGWYSDFFYDDAGRLIRIETTPGTGTNPFPWPSGTTTVTSDANGNITRMENGTWVVEADFDYENRLKRLSIPGYPEIHFTYDGVGRIVRETIGGVETRFVRDGDRIIQERDASNNLLEEYFWDGGRLFKQGTGANSRFPQAQISGTPERWTDTSGEFTGGSLFSRSGQPVESYNDAQLRVGWGGERKYPVPGLYGSYWASLHRPFNRIHGGLLNNLPFIGFPTASYQGILGTLNLPVLPAVAQRVLMQTDRSLYDPMGRSSGVDSDWSSGVARSSGYASGPPPAGCSSCYNDTEGTQTVVISAQALECADGKPAEVPGAGRYHVPPGGCLMGCPKEGGGMEYTVLPPGHAHCRNVGKCCPATARCGRHEVVGCARFGGPTDWSKTQMDLDDPWQPPWPHKGRPCT
ncbi:MAG: hypothetical protein V2G48_05050, partial [bacterium JZ-2024 1]